MKISNSYNSYNLAMRALVPKKDYKGIILKLTEDDIQKIKELNTKKSLLELEMVKVLDACNGYKIKNMDSTWLNDTLGQLSYMISSIDAEILSIKQKRLNIQKLNLKKN